VGEGNGIDANAKEARRGWDIQIEHNNRIGIDESSRVELSRG
jgi:hypothetical protein